MKKKPQNCKKSALIRLFSASLVAIAAAGTVGCSPYAPAQGPRPSSVWGMLPFNAIVTPEQQHAMTSQNPYWPFMQLHAAKDLFAVKFSWMRPDEQPSPNATGGWLEFLAHQGGELEEEPEFVAAEVETANGRIPVRVTRLPVAGNRYFIGGVPVARMQKSTLFITAKFAEREDTVEIPMGTDSRE